MYRASLRTLMQVFNLKSSQPVTEDDYFTCFVVTVNYLRRLLVYHVQVCNKKSHINNYFQIFP